MEYLPKLEVKYHKRDEVIFVEEKACIILSGSIHVKSYINSKITAEIYAKY